jgi:hypothetical protein
MRLRVCLAYTLSSLIDGITRRIPSPSHYIVLLIFYNGSRKIALLRVATHQAPIIAVQLPAVAIPRSEPDRVPGNFDGVLVSARQDLRTMNAVITRYTLDKQLPPHSLDDLVAAGYLKEVPTDPMTGRKDTWVVKCSSNLSRRGIVGIDSGYKNTSNKRTLRYD